MPVSRSLGIYHVNKKHGVWTSSPAKRFIRRLGNWFFSFWRRRQFLLSSRCSIHISSGKPAISIHIFFHDVALAEARWNVKEKQKYWPQNVIRFHLHGCVLKRLPTLPTSKDTHSNDKRFGNLPPSFRSWAFFLRSINVKILALYKSPCKQSLF